MKDRPLDQSIGSASASVLPERRAVLQSWLFLLPGIVVGLAPLGFAALFAAAPYQFLHESWLSLAATVYVGEWLAAFIARAMSHKQSMQSLTKGMMWGLLVTTGVALFKLLAIAYYILTY